MNTGNFFYEKREGDVTKEYSSLYEMFPEIYLMQKNNVSFSNSITPISLETKEDQNYTSKRYQEESFLVNSLNYTKQREERTLAEPISPPLERRLYTSYVPWHLKEPPMPIQSSRNYYSKMRSLKYYRR